MKTFITSLLASATLLTGTLRADDLQPESVSVDAKWLIHLNLDAFRETMIGSTVFENVIKPNAGENPMGFRIKTEEIYRGVHALTAYGNSYPSNHSPIGVLLIRTDDRLRSIFEAALIQQEAAGDDGAQIKTVQDDPFPIYSMKNEIFAGILPGNTVVISKSLDTLAAAVDVIEDRAQGLDERTEPYDSSARVGESFFLLATAEAFNQSSIIPPQARVLQLADTIRLAVGENTEDLFLNLSLKAADEKTRNQLRKIIEGLLALVSLGQMDNQDFADIVLNTEVEATGDDVTIAMKYPTERVKQMIQSFAQVSHHAHADVDVDVDVKIDGDTVKIKSGPSKIEITNP